MILNVTLCDIKIFLKSFECLSSLASSIDFFMKRNNGPAIVTKMGTPRLIHVAVSFILQIIIFVDVLVHIVHQYLAKYLANSPGRCTGNC